MIKLAIIGTDSSHCIAFTKIFNKYYQDRITIVGAFRGGSSVPLSRTRIDKFSQQLSLLGIPFYDSLEELKQQVDGYLLLAVDGKQHLDYVRALNSFGIPIFIDKPLAISYKDAVEIVQLCKLNSMPLMSASALRYSMPHGCGDAVDIFAPMPLEQRDGYFWYGIHAVEMLAALVGVDVEHINVQSSDKMDLVTLTFSNGYVSTIRGFISNRENFNYAFHNKQQTIFHTIDEDLTSSYEKLVKRIVHFFETGEMPIESEELLQVIKIVEAINTSKSLKKGIWLK